uniref:Uncharacterized protein n=1 Tax=Podoviridae sp. ctdKF3 TaxID=2825261 RepID=A0A8S5PQ50_9CAUD|nr:MAG TPA: hypothetical protein [Podoviridae sp. ctdKF3]
MLLSVRGCLYFVPLVHHYNNISMMNSQYFFCILYKYLPISKYTDFLYNESVEIYKEV